MGNLNSLNGALCSGLHHFGWFQGAVLTGHQTFDLDISLAMGTAISPSRWNSVPSFFLGARAFVFFSL